MNVLLFFFGFSVGALFAFCILALMAIAKMEDEKDEK